MPDLLHLQDFAVVLKGKNLLEVTSPHWKKLTVGHGRQAMKEYDFKKPQELRALFRDQKNVCGIYAYFQNNKCLYIGKSGNLQERIYQHFLESCRIWGHERYQDFFADNCGTLDLFILPLAGRNRDGEFLRTIVEKILEAHYQPAMPSVKL